jgi:nicotinate-nucleotide adenylyltransferase
MVELAFLCEDRLEASEFECGSERSYSIHTIERLRARMDPGDRLLFIIGADAFDEIRTWHRWRDVIATVEFIVVSRPGHLYAVPDGAVVHSLASVQMPVSSSLIREKLTLCEKPEELPSAVFDYICRNRLYGFGSACR